MSLESQIDELYALPLGEFTAARNALAKTLSGSEAKAVRALAKPKLVPWAANQLYWKARPIFNRLLESGAALRSAQLAVISGRSSDVRRVTDAHRKALSAAAARAAELASAEGAPDLTAVARMLEGLSLAAAPSEHPGRWTEPVQLAGFEALAGLQPAAVARTSAASTAAGQESRREAERREAARQEEERLAAERTRLEQEVVRAEQAVADARADEKRAREALDSAIDARRAAEQALTAAHKTVARSI
jgi:hypothetical protein